MLKNWEVWRQRLQGISKIKPCVDIIKKVCHFIFLLKNICMGWFYKLNNSLFLQRSDKSMSDRKARSWKSLLMKDFMVFFIPLLKWTFVRLVSGYDIFSKSWNCVFIKQKLAATILQDQTINHLFFLWIFPRNLLNQFKKCPSFLDSVFKVLWNRKNFHSFVFLVRVKDRLLSERLVPYGS